MAQSLSSLFLVLSYVNHVEDAHQKLANLKLITNLCSNPDIEVKLGHEKDKIIKELNAKMSNIVTNFKSS